MNKKTVQTTTLAFILFAVVAGISGSFVHRSLRERYQTEELENVRELSASIRAEIESTLANDLLIIYSTAAYISVNPDVTSEEFQSFAAAIMRDSPTLANLAAAPDLTINFVYPIEGNEAIVGVDYRNLPEQLPLVYRARDTGDLVVAGPINVLQGGQGVLGRAPVYYDKDGTRVFWGVVSSLISFDALIAELTPFLNEHDLRLSVRGIDGSGASGDAFYGSNDLFQDGVGVRRMVLFPNGSWEIAVAPSGGWRTDHSYHLIVVVLLSLLVVLATAYTFGRSLVNERIRENEKRLEAITQASSDIIWETDPTGILTHVVGNGESLLGWKGEELIGRSLCDLTATSKDADAVASLRRTMAAGESIVDTEVWLTTSEDDLVCVLRNAVPRVDPASGKLIGYRGVDKNISVRKQLEVELQEKATLLDLFFRQSLDGFFFMMLDEPIEWNDSIDKEATLDYVFSHQRITKINAAMLQQYRASESDFVGLTPNDFFAHDIKAGRETWRKLFDDGRLHVDTMERRLDDSPMVTEGDYIVITDARGRITGHFGVQRDVSEERDAAYQLERYIAINDNHVITSQTDLDGIITYASTAFSETSGYTKEELVGENHNIIRHPDMPDALFKDLWETITAGKTWHGEIKNRSKDGGFYWVNAVVSPVENRMGERHGYMAVRQDITAKKQLEIVSVTDRLTGLYNRQKIDRALEDERIRFSRYGVIYSIIILDIDHFKSINDTFGHLEGDRILKSIALLITGQIRQTDVPGRWGGEEFLILCPHTDVEGAALRAEELRRSIENFDFSLDRPITASLGAAQVSPVVSEAADESDASDETAPHSVTEQLLRSADTALYAAKEGGRNRVVRGG